MLILTRKNMEEIIIGNEEIIIRVLDINRGQVKIGVEAPKDISIHRREVYNKIREDERTAKCVYKDEKQEVNQVAMAP